MKHMLVVDDSLVIRKTLKEYFSKKDFEVSTVADGRSFFDFIEKNSPDIIILDKVLPDIDGFNILFQIKLNAETSNIPVILFSTQDETDTEIRGLKLGAEVYLSKDSKLEEMEVWVEKILLKQERITNIKKNMGEMSRRISNRESELIHKSEQTRTLSTRYNKLAMDLIDMLLKLLEVRDFYTKKHSEKVSELSVIMASQSGMQRKEIEDIKIAGFLHDIGKIGISDSILNSPNLLNFESRKVIERHADIGADVLSSIESLRDIAPFVKYHHENFDGSGYPTGLKKEEIPFQSRVIRIADFFDAMSTDRVYRPAYSVEETIEIMQKNSGKLFDPQVFDLFVKIVNSSSAG